MLVAQKGKPVKRKHSDEILRERKTNFGEKSVSIARRDRFSCQLPDITISKINIILKAG